MGPLGRGISATACARLDTGAAACENIGGGLATSFAEVSLNGADSDDVFLASGSGYYRNASVVTQTGALYSGQVNGINEVLAPVNGRVTYAATGQNTRCVLVEESNQHQVLCGSDSSAPDTPVTGLPTGRVLSMDVGYGDACALVDGEGVYCWKTTSNYVTPGDQGAFEAVPIDLPKNNPTLVSVSEYRGCVAYADGDASCFSNTPEWGAFSIGSFADIQIVDIAGGKDHTCFLDAEGRTYCAKQREDVPTLEGALPAYKDISAGWNNWVCGVTLENDVECFDKANPSSTTAVNIGGKAAAAACRD